jgi:hypothetical protein
VNNLNVRPQNFSWLLFVLCLVVVYGYTQRRWPLWSVAALPALVALWVNVHGAFVLGIVLVGGAALGETVRCLQGGPEAPSRRRVLALYVAALASVLVLLVNPRGAGVVDWVRLLLTDPATQALIAEWQPPSPQNPANVVFYVAILALLGASALAPRRPGPTDLVLLTALLWLAWSGQRYVVWFGMAAAPVLAYCLGREPIARSAPADRSTNRDTRSRAVANWVLAGAILAPVVLVQPWLIHTLPLPQEYVQRVETAAPNVPATETPYEAATYLKENPGGRLFNDMSFGSYLIWATPSQAVFVDPRVELYPSVLVYDYLRITEGKDATTLLAHYGVDRVLLSRQFQPKLSDALAASGAWRREHADPLAELWRRET